VFAARFIGTPPMNIVAAPGRPGLELGVRPEHVRLVESGGVAGVVLSAEYLGADTVITCSTSATGKLAETVAARLPGRHELAEGMPVRLGWSAEDCHFFDAATGLSRRVDVAVPVPA
jgi:sn-glycerol 3-phosphate transport system ATP-binding protein